MAGTSSASSSACNCASSSCAGFSGASQKRMAHNPTHERERMHVHTNGRTRERVQGQTRKRASLVTLSHRP
eukprot:5708178-Alexandrium_andersonii.AAC.1